MNKLTKNAAREFLATRISKGFGVAVRSVWQEWLVFGQHRSALKRVGPFLQRPEKKLNLGCGPNPKSGWINIDLFNPHADLHLDLRERWPFADASVRCIYSEHVFEHFEIDEEVSHFLTEAFRVLLPGGVFDVGVPDTEWPLHAYSNPEDTYWAFSKTVHPEWCETQLDHINYHFRQGTQHKYAWDYETLAMNLRRYGFAEIERREFDPALDAESRKIGTLYMRAIKP